MIREYGTPAELSQARLKAMTEEAASKLEVAEQEALAEQRTFEQDVTEPDEIARKRLAENSMNKYEFFLRVLDGLGEGILQRDADYEQQKRSEELRKGSIDVEFKVKECKECKE